MKSKGIIDPNSINVIDPRTKAYLEKRSKPRGKVYDKPNRNVVYGYGYNGNIVRTKLNF